jgi:hypothetical protein
MGENSCGFQYVFVNNKEARKHEEVGEVTEAWLKEKMPNTLPLLKLSQDAVNVIFTNNVGDERVQISAWIIAHRFSHAMARYMGLGGGGNDQKGAVAYQFHEIRNVLIASCSRLLSTYGMEVADSDRKLSYERRYGRGKSAEALLSFYQAIGTMKSARERNIRTEFEFMHELLAQYLLTGKITFNPLPRMFNHGKPAWGKYPNAQHFKANDNDHDYHNLMLEDLAETITEMFENILNMCVGRIFVM